MSASVDGDSIAWTLLASSAGRLRQQRDRLDRLLLEVQRARLDVGVGGARVGQELHPRDEEREAADLVEHAEAPLALADEVMSAVGRGQVPHDGGDRADPMQVVEARVLGVGLLLQQEADLRLGAHGLLGAGDRLLALDRNGQDHAREQHHVAHRQDDQHVRRQGGRLARFGRGSGRSGGRILVRTHVRTFGELSAGSAAAADSRARNPARSSPTPRAAGRAGARRARTGSPAAGSSRRDADAEGAAPRARRAARRPARPASRSGVTPGNAISISSSPSPS